MQAPDEFDPEIGVAEEVAPDIRRIVAPNPSPMTYRGTNTYIVGTSSVAVIDPGPDDPRHLAAILSALGPGTEVTHIVVTHTHLDHSPLARALADRTGAPILAFGAATDGRSPVMQRLAANGLMGGGEGVDSGFVPDRRVADGDVIVGSGWSLEVLHLPGHIGNHIGLAAGDLCFTADHVMGWASSLVSPPDGDLTDFMVSCARLADRRWSRFLPGHGDVVDRPAARLDWLIAHRKNREAEILARLEHGAATAEELAAAIYTETPAALLGAAKRNVLAHLVDLTGKSIVAPEGKLHAEATFRRQD